MEHIDTQALFKSIAALISRHPYLPMSNISYNRNFVDILARSQMVWQTYSHVMHEDRTLASDGVQLEFAEADDVDYDGEKVSELKRRISASVETSSALLESPLQGLAEDVKALKAACRQQKLDATKTIKAFIVASPFFYNSDALPKYDLLPDQPLSHIRSADPAEIQSMYADLFIAHLAPVLIQLANTKGFGELHRLTNTVINNFIGKDVHRATALYSKHDHRSFSKRIISIESVPAQYTSLRGALAGDCSMASIPYYGMHRDSRVFWIRKTHDIEAKPAGYAFVVSVTIEGRSYPYIPTINGAGLSVADVRHILYAVGRYYGCDQILISDPDRTSYLINYVNIIHVFKETDGEQLEIALPVGWEEIQNISRKDLDYENYYRAENIKYVKKIDVSELETHVMKTEEIESCQRYREAELLSLDLISRSIVAHYYRTSIVNDGNLDMAEALGVTASNMKAIAYLQEVYTVGELSAQSFIELKKEFGLGPQALMDFPFRIRAKTLRILYEMFKDEYSNDVWKKIVTQTNRDIDVEMHRFGPSDTYYLDELRDLKASMPDVYIPDYWEKLLPFFFFQGHSEPDYYIINRFVKYFHSIGTIEKLLEFIDEYPSLQKTISVYDARWISFFDRAYHLLSDQAFCKSVITKLYVDNLKETKQKMMYRQIAQSFCAYTKWYRIDKREFFAAIELPEDEQNAVEAQMEIVEDK